MCSLCYSGKGCKKRCWVRDFACFCFCKYLLALLLLIITPHWPPLYARFCWWLCTHHVHLYGRRFVQHYPIPLCKLFIFYPPRFRHFSMNKLWTVIRLSTACSRKFWLYTMLNLLVNSVGASIWLLRSYEICNNHLPMTMKIWGIIFIQIDVRVNAVKSSSDEFFTILQDVTRTNDADSQEIT